MVIFFTVTPQGENRGSPMLLHSSKENSKQLGTLPRKPDEGGLLRILTAVRLWM
jgi:hypothetical protein